MDKNWELLQEKAENFNLNLNDDQINQFKEYWRLLDEYNKHTNLVSNTDQDIAIRKHFIDSISIGLIKDQIGWDETKTVIDIGIGGGFPGVPIIIVNPNWSLTAVDSIGKKTKFIELLAERLGLIDRIKVINARAEDLVREKDKRENFDIVVARAVSQLNILSEYCLPFVKQEGFFIAYKARGIEIELNQAQKAFAALGGEVTNITRYDLPDEESVERNLIIIRKIKPTPPNYPRKAGIPKKNPLV
ncbi:MAG: Ribosomal RNA small subunit methyltransferase G [uncultured bacterium]|nr:MAG: Ribosomal RNA small subunit methyltransferase G [uncultured bacterium]HBH17749.1 16S rRNA (guanine(527)-N(7))-methyltransferase RsmG [Cyanobacteria bacterium UBA9579]